jgi:hypothetical protein
MKMRFLLDSSLLVMLVLLSVSALPAQDSRRITEPQIPATCVILNANIEASNGVISASDDQRSFCVAMTTGTLRPAQDSKPGYLWARR